MFEPITRLEQLQIGASFERVRIDFKTTAPSLHDGDEISSDSAKLAKDVAAFANTLGGSIVLGAKEQHERLEALPGIRSRLIPKARQLLLGAADLCAPLPLLEVEVIPLGSDAAIVAANVWPVAGQPIGYRKSRNQSDTFFAFPYRSSTDTHYYRPEHLPMLMLPHYCKAIISMMNVPPEAAVQLPHASGDLLLGRVLCSLENCIRYNGVTFHDTRHNNYFQIPLDVIRTVFAASPRLWVIQTDPFLVMPYEKPQFDLGG